MELESIPSFDVSATRGDQTGGVLCLVGCRDEVDRVEGSGI